ncbi:MAG: DUF2238 domain-containing protein [Treponema sp.]|jgi:uncharacterized membrane protein YjdF|nr:DUF2238 domain-containing protein [Treponema sp.]
MLGKKKRNIAILISFFVLVSLILSFIYSIIGLTFTALGMTSWASLHTKEGFIKIALQCILGISLIYLPGLLKKHLKIAIADRIRLLYVLFLYAAIILGEVQNFYRDFPHWDTLLHTCSGVMLGFFGFALIDLLNENKTLPIKLNKWFVALFSFCFAVTLGAFWEVIEFVMDLLLDLNMQQYMTYSGTVLVGKAALFDTMKDLVVDILGAVFSCTIGFLTLKKREKDEMNCLA